MTYIWHFLYMSGIVDANFYYYLEDNKTFSFSYLIYYFWSVDNIMFASLFEPNDVSNWTKIFSKMFVILLCENKTTSQS